ncbi:hypothetical protein Herod_00003 [Acinetobacter phage Herod]|nr:hypothetical protein Herod_00003 [Acinetobacter phage Herod]
MNLKFVIMNSYQANKLNKLKGKTMNNMINVPVEFVIDALQARYDDVKQHWGNDASEALWEQALDLVEECGLGSDITSPSAYVDNYLINGEFISKEDNIEDWLHKTSHDGCFEQLNYEGDEYDQWLDDNFDNFWQEYCQDNALIYNDEYACLSF